MSHATIRINPQKCPQNGNADAEIDTEGTCDQENSP